MKQRIFNKGRGWYISAKNRYDKEDRAYMNVFFPMRNQPDRLPLPGEAYSFVDIEIIGHKFEAYNGKIQLKVFEYNLIATCDDVSQQNDAQEEYPDAPLPEEEDGPWNTNV